MNAVVCAANLFSFIENIGTVQAILFAVGLMLLIAEMFMPGFGIAGGLGTLIMIAGIVMTAETAAQAVVMVLILILLIVIVLLVILRSAKKGRLSKTLVLNSSLNKEEGYSSSPDNSALVGTEGIALSLLRPSGIGEFDGRRVDVVSDGRYIEAGTEITVVYTEGRRIVVKPTQIDT